MAEEKKSRKSLSLNVLPAGAVVTEPEPERPPKKERPELSEAEWLEKARSDIEEGEDSDGQHFRWALDSLGPSDRAALMIEALSQRWRKIEHLTTFLCDEDDSEPLGLEALPKPRRAEFNTVFRATMERIVQSWNLSVEIKGRDVSRLFLRLRGLLDKDNRRWLAEKGILADGIEAIEEVHYYIVTPQSSQQWRAAFDLGDDETAAELLALLVQRWARQRSVDFGGLLSFVKGDQESQILDREIANHSFFNQVFQLLVNLMFQDNYLQLDLYAEAFEAYFDDRTRKMMLRWVSSSRKRRWKKEMKEARRASAE